MKTRKMPGAMKQKYSAGTGPGGKEIFKIRTTNGINPDASDQNILDLKKLIDKVVEPVTLELVRQNNIEISEE